jgi:hypothetical protein
VDGRDPGCVGTLGLVDEIAGSVTPETSLKCFRPFPHKLVEEKIHNQIGMLIA